MFLFCIEEEAWSVFGPFTYRIFACFSSSDMYVYALVPGWILYGTIDDDGQCIYVCLDDCDYFVFPFFLVSSARPFCI